MSLIIFIYLIKYVVYISLKSINFYNKRRLLIIIFQNEYCNKYSFKYFEYFAYFFNKHVKKFNFIFFNFSSQIRQKRNYLQKFSHKSPIKICESQKN